MEIEKLEQIILQLVIVLLPPMSPIIAVKEDLKTGFENNFVSVSC